MAEPANRQDKPGGGKFYLHPVTNEVFDSVTSALDTFDKDGLKIWAGQVAARFAIDHLPSISNAVINPSCGNTYNRCYNKHGRDGRCERCPCGDCEECWYRRVAWQHAAESGRRAQEGTETHEAITHWALFGGDLRKLRPEVQPYFNSFLRFAADYGIKPRTEQDPGSFEHTEVTLLNRAHRYAGTSDTVLVLRPDAPKSSELLAALDVPELRVRIDYKTREKPDARVFNDMPLQLVAYNRCDVAMTPDGREFPAPLADAVAVLQLRPSDYSFILTDDSDPVFQVFLNVLANYRWLGKEAKGSYDQGAQLLRLRERLHFSERPIVVPAGEIYDDGIQTVHVAALSGWEDPWSEPSPAPTTVAPESASPAQSVAAQSPPERDPWASHNNPAQRARDGGAKAAKPGKPGTSATLASLDRFVLGKPTPAALDEQIPF